LTANHVHRRTLPVGESYVGGSEPMVLEAYLGTCVGVAVYDDHRRVGGMVHLALPEPAVNEPVAELTYASIGLPVFLRALYERGAQAERMRAAVAGGALLGPVGHRDIKMDIGGRTLEVVRDVLQREGVAVVQAETGGFYGSRLDLDLESGDMTIDPVGSEKARRQAAAELPTPEGLQEKLDKLQPVPQVALKILRLLESGDCLLSEIAEEVRKDQVISARTLQICNSVSYAPRKKIDTVDYALIYLGQETFTRMVLMACIQEFFDVCSSGYSVVFGGLYRHAIGAAMLTEHLCRHIDTVSAALAYTAGLLHDIGKVVLDQHVDAGWPLFYRQLQNGSGLCELERLHLGMDHPTAGRLLAERWNLPSILAEVIGCHHQPGQARHNPQLVSLVYLTEVMMAAFFKGLDVETVDQSELHTALAPLGIEPTALADFITRNLASVAPMLSTILFAS
jgi:putative nucleotidyltransferase with HDIG domain